MAGSLGGIVVCIAAAACGSVVAPAGPKPSAPASGASVLAAFGRAPAVVAAEGSAKVSYSVKVATGGHTTTVSAAGGYDFLERSGTIVETIPGLAAGPINAVFDSTSMAIELPAAVRKPLKLSKRWIEVPTAGFVGAGQTNDPTQELSLLKSVGSVTSAGTDTIDGVPCARYNGAIDSAKDLALLGPDARALIAKSRVALPKTFPVDVCLDAKGLPRQITSHLTLTVSGTPLVEDISYDLTDFGTPVTAILPPADQVQHEASFTAWLASLKAVGGTTSA
jgi:hypothetical protein